MAFIAGYFIAGILISGVVAFVGRKRPNTESSPLWLLIDTHPLALLVFILLWPLLILAQLYERSPPLSSPSRPDGPSRQIVIGEIGRAVTDLKPGGKVRIASGIIDAVCDTGIIAQDCEVEVLSTMPTGIRVRERKVEPCAARNGGPAEPLGNSNVSGWPPSVS